jgi:hypothetical protein
MVRTALIATPYVEIMQLYLDACHQFGFSRVDIVVRPEDAFQMARSMKYDLVVCEAGWRDPFSDVSMAEGLYELVKSNPDTRFQAITGNSNALRSCEEKGIPVIVNAKVNLVELLKNFK